MLQLIEQHNDAGGLTPLFKALKSFGLLSSNDILFSDLSLTQSDRRNRNVIVTRKDSVGYLIKRPMEAAALHSLHYEAAFYIFAEESLGDADLKKLIPALHYYERSKNLLALEFIPNAENLWQNYRGCGPDLTGKDPCGALGQAIGTLHHRLQKYVQNPELRWMRTEVPWVFNVHKPSPELLSTVSPANYESIRIIQTEDGVADQLDRLPDIWTAKTIIHGDLKSDNILVSLDGSGCKILDWELVQFGDPAWDVAGVFCDFLTFWISSLNHAVDLRNVAGNSRYPLHALHNRIREFYRHYVAAQPEPLGPDFLTRAVQYSGARLIQAALESGNFANELSPTGVLLLQLGRNILASPEDHQVRTLGLFESD